MKHEELAGVRVDNCELREALEEADAYLGSNVLNIVEMVNMKTVVAAGEDENVRDCLAGMDLVIPADKEILQAMGIVSEQRVREVSEDLLLHEMMELLRERQAALYLLAADQEQAEMLRDYLIGTYGEQLAVCGSYSMEDSGGDTEDIVNQINAVAPDVILSALPTPEQEHFLYGHRQMLNAKLWFGIGAESDVLSGGNTPGRLYRKMLARRKMKRQILSYEASEEES